MAESASLLRKFTGNCNEGSNPSLSAIFNAQQKKNYSGRSAVRLAHLVWDQGVAGSNPAAPTC